MSWGVRTMKSKRSCFSGALLRRDLSRFWAVWALAALVGSLAYFGVANEAVRYLRLLCGGTDHYRYLNVSSNVATAPCEAVAQRWAKLRQPDML